MAQQSDRACDLYLAAKNTNRREERKRMSNAVARRTLLTTAAAATAAGAFGAPSRTQHRMIEVGDVALECTFSGLGIPVVLLANAGCSVGYLDYLADMLATRGFQAVSINIRGV